MIKPLLLTLLLMWPVAGYAGDPVWPYDNLYRQGTDTGARYLSEHMNNILLHALFYNCDDPQAANIMATIFPNSVAYALGATVQSDLSRMEKQIAAQITRAYILGFEVGANIVLFEKNPLGPESVKRLCDVVANTARQVPEP